MAVLVALYRSDHELEELKATSGLMFLNSPLINEFAGAIESLKKLSLRLTNIPDEMDFHVYLFIMIGTLIVITTI